MSMIECRNIAHYYGNKLIYKDISFSVEKGKILGLLGKNGTGKTTIINILNGYLQPISGECFLLGKNIKALTIEDKARIGLLLEGHVQYDFFNIHQIEKFYAPFFGKRWKRDAYYGLMDKLKVTPKQKLSTMSCGQRSQVALGLLFAQDPDLLILDDFSMGLDPGYRRLFVEYMKEWATAGDKTIFLTSHIIQDMEYMIDDCMIMDYGRLLMHKPTREILEGFHRFVFPLTADHALPKHPDLYHLERRANGLCEVYSFISLEDLLTLLSAQGIAVDPSSLRCEQLTLEDAFIGLTGKY